MATALLGEVANIPRIDTLQMEVDRPGFFFGGGFEHSRGSNLFGERPFLGAIFATSPRSAVAKESLFANEITVFLNNPAVIEIWRDGHMLSIGNYTSGNQIINTENLPAGAYPITLRIVESNGNKTEIQRFLIKSSEFPPRDYPIYFVETGLITSLDANTVLPASTNEWLLHLGSSWRISDYQAIGGQAFIYPKIKILELDFLHMNPVLNLQASIATDNLRNTSAMIFGNVGWGPLNISTQWRRNQVINTKTAAAQRLLGNFSTESIRLMLSASLVRNNQIRFTAESYNNSFDVQQRLGIALRSPLAKIGNSQLTFSVEASWLANGEHAVFATLELYRSENKATLAMNGNYANLNNKENITKDLTIQHSWESSSINDINVWTNFSHATDHDYAGGRLNLNTDFANVNFSGQNYSSAGGSTNSYQAAFGTTSLFGNNGIGFGSAGNGEAGILVILQGDENSNARFKLIANKQVIATNLSIGERRPIALAAYHSYQIRLEAIGTPAISYDMNTRDLVLFPGNVQVITWNFSAIIAIFGRIVTKDGAPLTNARLIDLDGYQSTDANGYFQAEIPSSYKSLRLQQNQSTICKIEFSGTNQDKFMDLGDITCI
ncbi:hypothetical protein TI04_04215 [Achromatium sp. WMS2]|nr:hypothetical protein TI04_04215 [Achromatium sp. WMS2]